MSLEKGSDSHYYDDAERKSRVTQVEGSEVKESQDNQEKFDAIEFMHKTNLGRMNEAIKSVWNKPLDKETTEKIAETFKWAKNDVQDWFDKHPTIEAGAVGTLLSMGAAGGWAALTDGSVAGIAMTGGAFAAGVTALIAGWDKWSKKLDI